jgi:hypothetical protein
MDQVGTPANGPRRTEDIALDLFKFVAGAAGVGRTGTPSTGFVASTVSKTEEHVNQLLDLYSKCLRAVQAK